MSWWAGTMRAARLALHGPGSRFILIGVVCLVLSLGILGWSNASEWRYQVHRPTPPPAESLPERFDSAASRTAPRVVESP